MNIVSKITQNLFPVMWTLFLSNNVMSANKTSVSANTVSHVTPCSVPYCVVVHEHMLSVHPDNSLESAKFVFYAVISQNLQFRLHHGNQ